MTPLPHPWTSSLQPLNPATSHNNNNINNGGLHACVRAAEDIKPIRVTRANTKEMWEKNIVLVCVDMVSNYDILPNPPASVLNLKGCVVKFTKKKCHMQHLVRISQERLDVMSGGQMSWLDLDQHSCHFQLLFFCFQEKRSDKPTVHDT